MALMMIFTLLPTTAFAADTDHTYSTKDAALAATDVTANKTVTDNGNGSYTITLSVQGTSDTTSETTRLPADIALIIDSSGSMDDKTGARVKCGKTLVQKDWYGRTYYECEDGHFNWSLPTDGLCQEMVRRNRMYYAKEAATAFVTELLKYDDVKIGLADFSGGNWFCDSNSGGRKRQHVELTDDQTTLTNAIQNLSEEHEDGTNYAAGLKAAEAILKNGTARQQFVVFISDGEPSKYSSQPEAYKSDANGTGAAEDLWGAGVTIISVGIDMDDSDALDAISSKDSEGEPYCFISAADGLKAILDTITDIIESTINAGENAVMTDVINTDSFDLVVPEGDLPEGLEVEGDTLTWDIGTIGATGKTVSFDIQLKGTNTAFGQVLTNKDVSLVFDSTKQNAEVEFTAGAIGTPYAEIYKVTYTDGVDDETVFTDEVNYNLLEGDDTPAFSDGEPEREGYTFTGWTPEWEDTIGGSNYDITYAATWEEITAPKVENVAKTGTVRVSQDSAPKTAVQAGDVIDYEVTFASQAKYFSVADEKLPTNLDNIAVTAKIGSDDVDFTKAWTTVVENGVTKDVQPLLITLNDEPTSPVTVTVTYSYTVTEGDMTGGAVTNKATVRAWNNPDKPSDPETDEESIDIDKYDITGITKDLVTSSVGLPEGVTYTAPTMENGKVVIPTDGVTLLYKITVSGQEGATFSVTDNKATLVGNGAPGGVQEVTVKNNDGTVTKTFDGTIGSGGTAVFYVTKSFTPSDIDDGKVSNTASVAHGSNAEGTGSATKETDAVPATATVTKAPVTTNSVAGVSASYTPVTEVVVTDEATGETTTSYKVDVPENATTVTLLYAVTATSNGKVNTTLSLQDPGAVYVGSNTGSFSVTPVYAAGASTTDTVQVNFTDAGTAKVYFTKTFDIGTDALANTVIVNGQEEIPSEPVEVNKVDVGIQKTVKVGNTSVDQGTVKSGDVLTFTVTLTNNTDAAASNVQFTDKLTATKDGTSTVRDLIIPDGVTATKGADGTYTFTVATVPANGDATVTYTYTVTDADQGCTLKNAATVVTKSGEMPKDDVEVKVNDPTYTVTFDSNGGNVVPAQPVKKGAKAVKPTDPTRSGYTFNGWYLNGAEYNFNTPVTGNITLVANWTANNIDDGDSTTRYELRYNPNGGTVNPRYESETRPWVKDYDELPVPSRPGYVFTGWYDKNGNLITDDVKVDKSQVTITAGWRESAVPGMLNGDDHFAYIQGYADGTVRPNNYITRAQVATIFFRLLDEDVRDDNLTTYNDFPDVAEDYWANTAISTMTKLGVIHGYKDGNFRPNAYITRAEFAAICARFDDTVKSGNSSFTDINGHWAKAEIERAATLGWIQGYSDGTFRPNNNITRAQAMTMINRVLCRLPEDEDDLLRGMNTWTDCNPGDWCYLAVQEATNSHDFQHRGVYESWTDLNRDPDWSKYEN